MERRQFVGGKWERLIDVRDFIQKNYTLYEGNSSFLVGPTEKTRKVWDKCLELLDEGCDLLLATGGVYDVHQLVLFTYLCHLSTSFWTLWPLLSAGARLPAQIDRLNYYTLFCNFCK